MARRPRSRLLRAVPVAACLAACGPGGTESPGPAGPPARTDTSGTCSGPCDASPPSIPALGDTFGFGDVTTYGGTVPGHSRGGACNYGETAILHYAAIQVDSLPGDGRGQWRGGRTCGQCVRVRVRTPDGWRSTVARVVDKCPDAHCGIDLGGAPAGEVMGDRPGRYSGEWSFVPCAGHPGVSDGPPVLQVKDGSNAYWSLVQVRNPDERVLAIRFRPAGSGAAWTALEWATEAENFFRVPSAVSRDSGAYDWEIDLPRGTAYGLRCPGSALAEAGAALPLRTLP